MPNSTGLKRTGFTARLRSKPRLQAVQVVMELHLSVPMMWSTDEIKALIQKGAKSAMGRRYVKLSELKFREEFATYSQVKGRWVHLVKRGK